MRAMSKCSIGCSSDTDYDKGLKLLEVNEGHVTILALAQQLKPLVIN